jgi:TP901 family phage tail tape measure protein
MARNFNLTANLVLAGPTNLRPIVSSIRTQLANIKADVDVKINPATAPNLRTLNTAFINFNTTLATSASNIKTVSTALGNLNSAINGINLKALNQNLTNVSTSANKVTKSAAGARTELEEFGRVGGLAVRRFAGFAAATGIIMGFIMKVKEGVSEAIAFQHQMVRLAQLSGNTTSGMKTLADTISGLSTSLGVSSSKLMSISDTLIQAGLSANDTKTALEALAKTMLAPAFDNIEKTTEGSIAMMAQFKLKASDLEGALGAMNAVAAKFAVESQDLITAVRIAGGSFATMSQGVDTGMESLNKFMALFTSVRGTTRESAESIATGLRTIFTRLERSDTITQLQQLGVELTDLEGKFVGPYEAITRISGAMKKMDPRDLRFAQIAESLGGYRQIGKVIPLLLQNEMAVKALGVAQQGQASLSDSAAKAQESWTVQLTKTHEKFLALMRDISNSSSFKAIITSVTGLANAFIGLASSITPILPYIGLIMGMKAISGAKQILPGFFAGIKGRGMASGGMVPGYGNGDTVPAMLTPGEFVIRKKAVEKIGASNLHSINGYANGGIIDPKKGVGAIFLNPKDVSDYNEPINPKEFGGKGKSFNVPVHSASIGQVGVNKFDEALLPGIRKAIIGGANYISKMTGYHGAPLRQINKIPNEAGISGSLFEGVIAAFGADVGTGEDTRTWDFPSGLRGGISGIFNNGKLKDIPVDAKRTASGDAKSSIHGKIVKTFLDATPLARSDFEKGGSRAGTPQGSIYRSAIANQNAGKALTIPQQQLFEKLGLNKATGGSVDTVPAMLTPGEFVINKNAAARLGRSTLTQLNHADKFATGGPVQYFQNGGRTQFSDLVEGAAKKNLNIPFGPISPADSARLAVEVKNLITAINTETASLKRMGVSDEALLVAKRVVAQALKNGATMEEALAKASRRVIDQRTIMGRASTLVNKIGGVGTAGFMASMAIDQMGGDTNRFTKGLSGGLAGAATGAMMGGQFGGAHGAAIGTVIGGAVGTVQGVAGANETARLNKEQKELADSTKRVSESFERLELGTGNFESYTQDRQTNLDKTRAIDEREYQRQSEEASPKSGNTWGNQILRGLGNMFTFEAYRGRGSFSRNIDQESKDKTKADKTYGENRQRQYKSYIDNDLKLMMKDAKAGMSEADLKNKYKEHIKGMGMANVDPLLLKSKGFTSDMAEQAGWEKVVTPALAIVELEKSLSRTAKEFDNFNLQLEKASAILRNPDMESMNAASVSNSLLTGGAYRQFNVNKFDNPKAFTGAELGEELEKLYGGFGIDNEFTRGNAKRLEENKNLDFSKIDELAAKSKKENPVDAYQEALSTILANAGMDKDSKDAQTYKDIIATKINKGTKGAMSTTEAEKANLGEELDKTQTKTTKTLVDTGSDLAKREVEMQLRYIAALEVQIQLQNKKNVIEIGLVRLEQEQLLMMSQAINPAHEMTAVEASAPNRARLDTMGQQFGLGAGQGMNVDAIKQRMRTLETEKADLRNQRRNTLVGDDVSIIDKKLEENANYIVQGNELLKTLHTDNSQQIAVLTELQNLQKRQEATRKTVLDVASMDPNELGRKQRQMEKLAGFQAGSFKPQGFMDMRDIREALSFMAPMMKQESIVDIEKKLGVGALRGAGNFPGLEADVAGGGPQIDNLVATLKNLQKIQFNAGNLTLQYSGNNLTIQGDKAEKIREERGRVGEKLEPVSKAFGGRIGGAASDTVPAWLTPGEFVVNARAAQENMGLLQEINGMAKGGRVSPEMKRRHLQSILHSNMRNWDDTRFNLPEPPASPPQPTKVSIPELAFTQGGSGTAPAAELVGTPGFDSDIMTIPAAPAPEPIKRLSPREMHLATLKYFEDRKKMNRREQEKEIRGDYFGPGAVRRRQEAFAEVSLPSETTTFGPNWAPKGVTKFSDKTTWGSGQLSNTKESRDTNKDSSNVMKFPFVSDNASKFLANYSALTGGLTQRPTGETAEERKERIHTAVVANRGYAAGGLVRGYATGGSVSDGNPELSMAMNNWATAANNLKIPETIKLEGIHTHTHVVTGESALAVAIVGAVQEYIATYVDKQLDKTISRDTGETKPRGPGSPIGA